MKSNIVILTFSLFLILSCKQEVKKENVKEATKAEIVQDNKTEFSDNEEQQKNANCFTQKDIENLNLLFKAISEKGSNSKTNNDIFKFKEKDLGNLRELLTSENFDSFELKHNKVECDTYLILDILERQKFEDDGDIHYSERNIMYELKKKGNSVIVESAGVAG
jgi:hypothetical protein